MKQMVSDRNKIRARLILTLAVLIGLNFFGGCIYKAVHPAGLMESARPIYEEDFEILGPAEGKSSSFKLFWFIPVTPQINMDEAIDEAIRKGNGDNLIDVRIYTRGQIWLIGTSKVLIVEGKAVRYR